MLLFILIEDLFLKNDLISAIYLFLHVSFYPRFLTRL